MRETRVEQKKNKLPFNNRSEYYAFFTAKEFDSREKVSQIKYSTTWGIDTSVRQKMTGRRGDER